MLKDLIDSTKLSPNFCAALVGVEAGHFNEWLNGTLPVPAFVIPELATVLGVPEERLSAPSSEPVVSAEQLAPAVWYKLRDEQLTESDREMVGLVRKLGFYLGQLQRVSGRMSLEHAPLFATVREHVDRKAPPANQGKEAASRFRSASGLHHGNAGIGELIRPFFRRIGILLVETPLPKSSLEGCCFSVGADSNMTACVFANSYKSTWFRRNEIILHEICHAIFDLENDPVSVDFKAHDAPANGGHLQLKEARAQAFSQECLVPTSVLMHFTNQFGIRWSSLTPRDLGRLVAHTHAEQKLILSAASDAGLINQEERSRFGAFDCAQQVRELSDHALTTREYLKQRAEESPKWVAEARNTEIGTRKLRLPVGYVDQILSALNAGRISLGKAAEMAMMDKRVFYQRFKALIQPLE